MFEPYFSILTHPRFLRAQFDDAAAAEFFASGQAYVESLYQRHGPAFQPRTVLEYGCGVGRLAIPFAKRGARVTGVDADPRMLEVARSHAPDIEYVDSRTFAGDDRKFDLVNCYLVLQRLRPAEGLALLRELIRRVADGGTLVVQFPYRGMPLAKRVSREVRTRLTALDAMRGRPYIPTHTYDLAEVLELLRGLGEPRLVLEKQGELDVVIVDVTRPVAAAEVVAEEPAAPAEELYRLPDLSLETLNRTAEEYFASLKDWEHHLAKPFAKAEDAPHILVNLATMLQGLALRPGLRVLEFGAGTGWLSRWFTQLGCEAILLDVSPTALNIARELYRRQPPIGERPEPQFVVFDGRRVDLPDDSVDRIVCFDAFHHAPDPDAALRELGRVLKPGGIAAFAEPGPHHSKTPQSQFEMRTYGVLENDVDIHALWRTAEAIGFSEMRIAAFNSRPFHMSLREFDELLAGGPTYARWAQITREFLHDNRTFFLRKGGHEELDSRTAGALGCELEVSMSGANVRAIVRNSGSGKWLPSHEKFGGVVLGVHLYDVSGRLVDLDFHWQPMPRALPPGDVATLEFTLPLKPGTHVVEFDCVANEVAWFAQTGGSRPVRVTTAV